MQTATGCCLASSIIFMNTPWTFYLLLYFTHTLSLSLPIHSIYYTCFLYCMMVKVLPWGTEDMNFIIPLARSQPHQSFKYPIGRAFNDNSLLTCMTLNWSISTFNPNLAVFQYIRGILGFFGLLFIYFPLWKHCCNPWHWQWMPNWPQTDGPRSRHSSLVFSRDSWYCDVLALPRAPSVNCGAWLEGFGVIRDGIGSW